MSIGLALMLCSAHAYLLPMPANVRSPSATMPRAAALTMEEAAPEMNIAETATGAIDQVMGMLGDGVDPPSNLRELKGAISTGDAMDIGEKMYWLLVEQALDYEILDGTMVKSEVDYNNTDDPKVKEKIGYIYSYGIGMFKKGFISGDKLKDAVLTKVASRVNMSGEELDKWLEIPAV